LEFRRLILTAARRRQGDAVHDAAEAVVVVDRVVLGAAIVPERDRADLPAESAGEFRALLVGEQILQQRCALFLHHVVEAHLAAIDVERPSAGLGVGADDRVQGLILALGISLAPSRIRSSRVLVSRRPWRRN
jgi:hypothetical protein